jgi:hypothetical protein
VTFETNRYSVPVEQAHRSLLLRAFLDRVEITDGTQVIASHGRSYGREEDILDPLHYLPLLRQRPGALDHARPLKVWPHPPVLDRYLEALRARLPQRAATLQFLDVLELTKNHPLQAVADAVEQALAASSLGADTVAYFLRAKGSATQERRTSVLAKAPPCPAVQGRDLRQYDLLLRR